MSYQSLDFSKAPDMPKGFPSKVQALAAAEIAAPGMKYDTEEKSWGWTVDIDDGEGSMGSIVQNGGIHWWTGGWRCERQMKTGYDR